MSSVDPRKAYILNSIKLIFRLDEAPKYLLKDSILLSFLNDSLPSFKVLLTPSKEVISLNIGEEGGMKRLEDEEKYALLTIIKFFDLLK